MSYRHSWQANGAHDEQQYWQSAGAAPAVITVQKLLSGIAHDGFLRMDDRIVAINGCDITFMGMQEALELCKTCGEMLTFTVQRQSSAGSYENRRQLRRRTHQTPVNGQQGVVITNTDQTNIVVQSSNRSKSANAQFERVASPSPPRLRIPRTPVDNVPNFHNGYDNQDAKFSDSSNDYFSLYPRFNATRSGADQDRSMASKVQHALKSKASSTSSSSLSPRTRNGNQHNNYENGFFSSAKGVPSGNAAKRENGASQWPAQGIAARRIVSQSVINLHKSNQDDELVRGFKANGWPSGARAQRKATPVVRGSEFDCVSLCEYISTPGAEQLGRVAQAPTRLHQIIASEQARQESNSGFGSSFADAAGRTRTADSRLFMCASQF